MSAATVAAAFGGELTLGVYPQLGLGEGLANLLRYTSLNEILKWVSLDIPAEAVRDYLYQKSIYPSTLPATPEDLAIEQALARQNLYVSLSTLAKDFPHQARRARGLTTLFRAHPGSWECHHACTNPWTEFAYPVGCHPTGGYYHNDFGSE